jgi:hypothetical protein
VREGKKRVGIAACLVVGLLLSTTLVLAPSASAFIYWANGGDDGTTIGRANNDGSLANPNFITGQKEPCGVAVDSQHIYWANQVGSSIGRANLDGSGVNPNFITTDVLLACGVAVDGTHIWWANQATSPSQTGQIARANLNGSGASVVYSGSTFVEGPRGVGVGSNLVFWSNAAASPQSIGRAGVDGTPPPVKNFIPLGSTSVPAWPTVAGNRVYFALLFGVTSTDLNGANLSPGVGSTGYGGIAVHDSKVYWANLTEGTLSRANLDLTSPDFAFMTGLGKPTGLAVDGGVASPASSPPSNEFTFSVKGKRLLVAVRAPGTVAVSDAGTRAASAAAKKKRRLRLRSSSASGGPPTIEVRLALTKVAKGILRRKGKVALNARVSFTPTGGVAKTETARLKVKSKKRR